MTPYRFLAAVVSGGQEMENRNERMEAIIMTDEIRKQIEECEKLLIGIGAEWKFEKNPEIKQAYEALYQLIKDKDYFIVTTNGLPASFKASSIT